MTKSSDGSGEIVAHGNKSLGSQQTAFDAAEVAPIEAALYRS